MQQNLRVLPADSSPEQRRTHLPERESQLQWCGVDPQIGTAPCVLIVDRDPMSSDLLANQLRQNGAYRAIAVPAPDLLTTLAKRPIDLVVIGGDVSYNARSGFALARAVSRAHPKVSLFVLLNAPTREVVIDAFRSGARGVFSRERPLAEFVDCIEYVRKGFICAQGMEATFLQEALMSIPAPSLTVAIGAPQLTCRQLQVVRHAAAGKTNKVIAAELRLSEHTVKNYLFRAFEKLGVSSRVELLFYLTLSERSFDPRTAASTTDSSNSESNEELVIEQRERKVNPQQDVERHGGI